MERLRITQQDVANKAGVHRATVSMALRNHPNIPEPTRLRILRLAKKLGYAPDPMLAALAVYRSRRRPAKYHGTLAWLVNSAFGYDWRERPHFVDYHSGAVSRAKLHGFKVEIFDLNSPQMSPSRTASILYSRNILGLLLCPQPRPETTLAFPWGDFSTVTFGYTLAEPQLHAVAPSHYRATLQIMRRLHELGYRRVGLALHADHDLRTDHNYLAGYLAGRQLAQAHAAIPPLNADYTDRLALRRWLRQHRVDAIVAGNYQILEVLKSLEVRVPEALGVACPLLPSVATKLSGMVENGPHIGAVAVDFLVSMIQRGERGIPETAERIQVEGRWHEGGSLRRPSVR